MQSGTENWNRNLLPLIIPWQRNETVSQESNQTLKLPFLGVHCLQISRTVLALSLYVIVPLSASQTLSVCSNEWQSGDVVLIYCMVAQMEPRWNVSVIGTSLRQKHLWCLGTAKCSIRNGFPPEPSVDFTHRHNRMHSKQNVYSALMELHSRWCSCIYTVCQRCSGVYK